MTSWTPRTTPATQTARAPRRRAVLATAAATGAALLLRARPAEASAAADPPDLRAAMARFVGGATPRFVGGATPREGRITIDLPELVENGNAVPVTVNVESPMTERNRVVALALFASRNPAPEVAEFQFGPRVGHARVSTRIRLATSQQVVALARLSDGTVWTRRVDVLVTLAACVES
jgi:sulfur-oxidizing protein SoxY